VSKASLGFHIYKLEDNYKGIYVIDRGTEVGVLHYCGADSNSSGNMTAYNIQINMKQFIDYDGDLMFEFVCSHCGIAINDRDVKYVYISSLLLHGEVVVAQ
jgi:hypothetical protein